ncbi:MAG TPA: hypothetical protein VF212_15410 [Longimicrobiales bacterium]
MPRIFHHNLRDYSGKAARADTFCNGYRHVANSFPDSVVVAGFTEVLTTRARTRLCGMAQALDAGLSRLVVIEVGQNVGGKRRGRVEYIGIAWNPLEVEVARAGFAVRHAVMRFGVCVDMKSVERRTEEIDDVRVSVITNKDRSNTIADHRGLAYIVGEFLGRKFLFGFMHNVYGTGVRTLDFAMVTPMAEAVRREAVKKLGDPSYATAEIIIGGDFNIEPHPPTTERGDRLMLYPRAATDRFGYVNTTRVHPYDYFLVNNPNIISNCVDAYTYTRAEPHTERLAASDHAAIILDYVLTKRPRI